jgi:hypothetical protein
MSKVKLNYLTPEEFKLSKEEVNMQIVLGLQSCKTKKDVSDLLDDVRAHERENVQKEIAEVTKVRDVLGKKHNELVDERNNALAKIEAAKQIVVEAPKTHKTLKELEGGGYCESQEYYTFEVTSFIEKLVALYIPRKEEKNGFVKLAGLMKKENTTT